MKTRLSILILWCICLCACQQKVTDIPITYYHTFPKDTIIELQELKINPQQNHVWSMYMTDKNIIIASSSSMEYKYAVFSYPEISFLHYTGPRSEYKAHLSLHDGVFWGVSDDSIHQYKIVKGDTLSRVSSSYLNSQLYDDDKIHIKKISKDAFTHTNIPEFNGMDEFYIFDTKNNKIKGVGRYPESSKYAESTENFKRTYFHNIDSKPDGSRIVVYYGRIRFYRIYDSQGNMLQQAFLDYDYPSTAKLANPDWDKSYWHFAGSFTTDKYIYLLCLDRKLSEDATPMSNIHVLDWEGRPIARYRLNQYITAFVVDEARNRVCAASSINPQYLYFFDL